MQPRTEVVVAAHRAGWDYALKNEERWIHGFMAEHDLDRKLGILIERFQKPGQREGVQCGSGLSILVN